MSRELLTSVLVAVFVIGLSCGSADAASILIDFGSAAYSGIDSPGHQDGSASGSAWNSIAEDSSSIVDEFGNSTQVSVDLGLTTSDTGFVADYTGPTKPASYDGSLDYSLFNTDLGVDHVVRNGSGLPGLAVAIRGLDYGEYEFFLTAFRGDHPGNAAHQYDIRFDTAMTDVVDFSGLPNLSLTNTTKTGLDWIAGDNYVTASFTIDTTTPNLYLVGNSSSYIGVINSLEIVSVPEPTSMLILSAGAAVIAMRRRR